jgi:hypothetical protein
LKVTASTFKVDGPKKGQTLLRITNPHHKGFLTIIQAACGTHNASLETKWQTWVSMCAGSLQQTSIPDSLTDICVPAAKTGVDIASSAITIIERLLNLPAEVQRRWLEAGEVAAHVEELRVAVQNSKDTLTTLRLRSEAESRARDEYADFLDRVLKKLKTFRKPTLVRKTLSLILPYYRWQMRLQRWKTRLEELQKNTNQLHPQQVLSCRQWLPQGLVVNHPARGTVAAALVPCANLQRPDSMPMVVQLSGLPGMGKTVLAAGLARELETKGKLTVSFSLEVAHATTQTRGAVAATCRDTLAAS